MPARRLSTYAAQTAANKGFFLKQHTARRQRAAGRRTPATFRLLQKPNDALQTNNARPAGRNADRAGRA
jgi:hypothetical protein